MWWFKGEGGEGGVSPDTFTANWLRVKGGGRGGSVPIHGYPFTKDSGRFLQHRFVQTLMPEAFKKSHKLLRSSKVLEERMLGDLGCKILA